MYIFEENGRKYYTDSVYTKEDILSEINDIITLYNDVNYWEDISEGIEYLELIHITNDVIERFFKYKTSDDSKIIPRNFNFLSTVHPFLILNIK